MINTVDDRGRTVFVAETKRELQVHADEIRRGGEPCRVFKRTINVDNGRAVVFVLVIYPRKERLG
jgi:hypothetical protein